MADKLHACTLEPSAAMQLQSRLREQRVLAWAALPVSSVAGIDVSVGSDQARAAIVVLSFPALESPEATMAKTPLNFPYIPGLLSFREGPAILAAWARLTGQLDLLLFDGQGIAHPRGIGIAAHMELWLSRPSISVAKSRLYRRTPRRARTRPRRPGRNAEPARTTARGRRPCAAAAGHHPVYIWPGHFMDVPHALALACVTR